MIDDNDVWWIGDDDDKGLMTDGWCLKIKGWRMDEDRWWCLIHHPMAKTRNAKNALHVFDISLPPQDESSSDRWKAAAKGHKKPFLCLYRLPPFLSPRGGTGRCMKSLFCSQTLETILGNCQRCNFVLLHPSPQRDFLLSTATPQLEQKGRKSNSSVGGATCQCIPPHPPN